MSAFRAATGAARVHYRVPAWQIISLDLIDSGSPAPDLADAGVRRRSLPLSLSFSGHSRLVLQAVEIAVDNFVDKEVSEGSAFYGPVVARRCRAGGRVLGPTQVTDSGALGVSRETLSRLLCSAHPRRHKQPGYVYFKRLSRPVRAAQLESLES